MREITKEKDPINVDIEVPIRIINILKRLEDPSKLNIKEKLNSCKVLINFYEFEMKRNMHFPFPLQNVYNTQFTSRPLSYIINHHYIKNGRLQVRSSEQADFGVATYLCYRQSSKICHDDAMYMHEFFNDNVMRTNKFKTPDELIKFLKRIYK